jgi:hypothetical protein
MNAPPDKELAADIMDRLMETMFAARDEFADRDPEGRALTLGIVLFLGSFMSSIKKWEDRQQMADAALGYSLHADEFLERRRNRKDPK